MSTIIEARLEDNDIVSLHMDASTACLIASYLHTTSRRILEAASHLDLYPEHEESTVLLREQADKLTKADAELMAIAGRMR